MRLEQLTGKQMDMYERVCSGVMLVSGAALITALSGAYFFWSGGMGLLVCGIVATVSVVVGLIAATKLRQLQRGWDGSDREGRGDINSALGVLDD